MRETEDGRGEEPAGRGAATGPTPLVAEMLGVAIEPTHFDLEHHELDPGRIVELTEGAGANTIRLGVFSHQGHAYYPSRIAPEAPFLRGRSLLREFRQECTRQGLRLVTYVNSKWVTDLHAEHPDWAVKFPEGPYTHPEKDPSLVIYPMCPNSPFIEYVKAIVREVVTVGRPDGVYIDNFGVEPFCECPSCRARFGARIPARRKWNSPDTQRYLKWFVRRSLRIAKEIVSAARTPAPHLPVVFNRGIFWTETGRYSPENNYQYAHRIANGTHAESAVRMLGDSFEHINEQCAFGRSIDLPLWTWVEYAMFPSSYTSCPALETKIKAAKVMANGGRPMVWHMPCAPLVSQKGMGGIREVFDLVRKNTNTFNGTRLARWAGIVFSSRAVMEYCQGDAGRLAEYRRTFSGAHVMMIRSHLPYDFLLDEHVVFDTLRKYKVIVLPNVVYLSKPQCDAIKQYVSRGGAVFATYQTSLYGRGGRMRKDFALKDVFGATYLKDLDEQVAGMGYAEFTSDHPINTGGLGEGLFPLGGRYLAVRSPDALAHVLARCRYYCDYPQPRTEHPALIARTYGRGKVVYVPGEYFRFYHERGLLEYGQLFGQALEWFVAGRMPVITDLPDAVELTLAKGKAGREVIHLVNCCFDRSRPVGEILPVRGRHLKLKTRRAYTKAVDITTGRKVSFEREKGYQRIDLPTLTGYNVIVLE